MSFYFKYFILTTICITCICCDLTVGKVYHITPAVDIPCPIAPCLTLTQFAANSKTYLNTSTVLMLLPGNHSLQLNFEIDNITSFEIRGSDSQFEASTIICTPSQNYGVSNFNIYNILQVYIHKIRYMGCTNFYAVIGYLLVLQSDFSYKSVTRETTLEVVGSSVNITRCSFMNNSAGGGQRATNRAGYTVGGAMVVTESIIDISDSIFVGNSAESGGAIYAEHGSTVSLFNSTFIENLVICFTPNIEVGSSCHGGSLYFEECTVNIYFSTFQSNVARAYIDDYAYGGALGFTYSTVIIHQSIFVDNIASTDGGAIYVRDTELISYSNAFYYNLALQDGGTFHTNRVYINDTESEFNENEAHRNGGVLIAYESSVAVSSSVYFYNEASASGGVFYMKGGSIKIIDSNLSMNAGKSGGVIATDQARILVHGCTFAHNKGYQGGVLNTDQAGIFRSRRDSDAFAGYTKHSMQSISIIESEFINNTATNIGGVFMIGTGKNTTISSCNFHNNKARQLGGVIYTRGLNTVIKICNFVNNTAQSIGILYLLNAASINLTMSTLINNRATQGIIYATDKSHIVLHDVKIVCNNAEVGGIYLIESTGVFSGNTLYSDNVGSVFVYNGNINITSYTKFTNCTSLKKDKTTDPQELEAGAITAFQSTIIFSGQCMLRDNEAQIGGAIYVSESSVHVYEGEVTVANNVAMDSGGGMYLYQSELHCHSKSILLLSENSATDKGGGIRSSSSSIKVDSLWTTEYGGALLKFTENEAKKGGGIFLEVNAKLYIQRRQWQAFFNKVPAVIYNKNSAEFGGAVYVDDSTNSGTCSSTSHIYGTTSSECFVQVMSLHNNLGHNKINVDINFFDNSATISGPTLFGGLLDRCTVSPYAEVYSKTYARHVIISGITYFKLVSNAELESVSSSPIGICFCKGNILDCSYTPPVIHVKKGEKFNVTLAAIDQVNNTIQTANIISSLSSNVGGLGENQSNQTIKDNCTELYFEIYSPNSTEELTMYADGPCKDALMSRKKLNIKFSPCSCLVGFQPIVSNSEMNQSKCECECDKKLERYITSCDPKTHTIVRRGNIWITYLNFTNNRGYLVYPNCPLDYCYAPGILIEINLNVPNGASAQCSQNRFGLLCGTCRPGLSLSLGGSNCIHCPAHWYATLIVILFASLIAGILLVTILLALNLTVAVGTLNGIIFYANIVSAFGSTFLPSVDNKPKFVTTIIAWLNLEVGFDACFFNGMNAYWKTLLHLAFPAYLISLVVIIIFASERYTIFARLIGRKNPVATLATLLLLSYTKVLNLIIASFSFAILNYPNNSSDVVWLPDASIGYLRGKHVILFVIGILILIGGIGYMVLLFFWQWLLRYQNKKLFRWVRYQRLHFFLEPYHAPYTYKHRYWTGFLLFIRAILYIISAANVSRDPGINLLAVGITMIGILLIRMIIQGNLYKKWLLDMLETSCFVNLLLFCLMQLFLLGGNTDQSHDNFIVVNISVSFTFVLFFIVLVYHVLTECFTQSPLWNKWKRNERALDDEEEMVQNVTGEGFNQPTYSIVDRPTPRDTLLPAIVEDNEGKDSEECSKMICTENVEHFSEEIRHQQTSLQTPYKLITY